MDLFKTIIPDEQLCENYKRISNNKYLVRIINQLTSGFEIERDGRDKFIKEFQSTFNSSLWEIYCYALFNSMGFNFDFSHERPDFVLNYKSIPFNVECVITNSSKGALPEYDIKEKLNPTKPLDSVVNDQVERLLNAMSSKYNKFQNGYSHEPWVNNKPFIIAVHAFEQPGFMKANTEAIRLVLYGRHYDVNNNNDDYISQVSKSNGSPIQTGLFSNESYKEVSGVFFSTLATTGKFRALSKEPLCIFEQLRFDPSSKTRVYQIDCRLDCKRNSSKYYEYMKMLNEYYNTSSSEIESIGAKCRAPLIQTSGYSEEIAEGLHFYLNPFATNPIPEELIDAFKKNHIIIHSFNVDSKQEEYEYLEDNYLIQRRVVVFPKH